MTKLFAISQTKEVNDSDRSIVAFGSKPVKDRDNELIKANAWQLENFLKNPVLMLSHNYAQPPVGKILWIKRKPEGLLFKAKFAKTQLGEEVYQLYKDGIMKAFSVGFIPDRSAIKQVDEKDEDNKPTGRKITVFEKCELLEISCVSVPCCPDALVEEVKSKTHDPVLKDVVLKIAEDSSKDSDEDDVTAPEEKAEDGDLFFSDDGCDELEAEEKPYPTEHACRLQDPAKYERFRRGTRTHEGKTYSVIWGIKDDTVEEQAYRYKKDVWTAEEAGAHCRDHSGKFEPAAEEAAAESGNEKIGEIPADDSSRSQVLKVLTELVAAVDSITRMIDKQQEFFKSMTGAIKAVEPDKEKPAEPEEVITLSIEEAPAPIEQKEQEAEEIIEVDLDMFKQVALETLKQAQSQHDAAQIKSLTDAIKVSFGKVL